MRRDLALRLLGRVMRWDDVEREREFRRLSLLERFKYDSYTDFVAGSRFIENLARWLQQFAIDDRATAYDFVKSRLLFITNAEIDRLVEAFFPNVVYYDVLDLIAKQLGVQSFQALETQSGRELFTKEIRKSLFVGVSDGARTDGASELVVGEARGA